jgi:PhnB protein
MSVSAIPNGYHNITPYLIVDGASKAIDWYKSALGATEVMRLGIPGGDRVGHAEMQIGDSRFMLADQNPEWNAHSPEKYGGSPVTIHLYVDDVDVVTAKAVAGGASLVRDVQDQFYGDRSGSVRDPFGHMWHIATHVEDVPHDEIERRMVAMHQS